MGDLTAALKVLSGHQVKKGDPPEHAARSDVMNAIRDAILSLARGENIGRGVGIRKRVGEGTFILSVDQEGGRRGGGASTHPFKVVSAATTPGSDPKIAVTPGTILGIIPNIAGTLLDADTEPTLSFGANGMVLLRVEISGVSPTFRPVISSVTIIKKDGLVIEDDDNDPLSELTMVWESEDDKVAGYFYIRIATIKSAVPPGESDATISEVIQFLMDNVYSFIINVDDVILLAK